MTQDNTQARSEEPRKESVKEKLARLKAQNDKNIAVNSTSDAAEGNMGLMADGGGMNNIARFMPKEIDIPDNFIQAQVKFPEFDAKQFATILSHLESAIEKQAPGIMNYLQEISTNLLQYPELTHILTNEQLHIICSGIFFETDHNMATVIARSKNRELTIDEGRHLFS